MFDDLTPKTAPIVLVDWADITTISNWNSIDEVTDTDLLSVGFLLEESPQRIVIASSYDYSEDRWADFTVFPKKQQEISRITQRSEDASSNEKS